MANPIASHCAKRMGEDFGPGSELGKCDAPPKPLAHVIASHLKLVEGDLASKFGQRAS